MGVQLSAVCQIVGGQVPLGACRYRPRRWVPVPGQEMSLAWPRGGLLSVHRPGLIGTAGYCQGFGCELGLCTVVLGRVRYRSWSPVIMSYFRPRHGAVPSPKSRARGSYRYGVYNRSEIKGTCRGRALLKSRRNCRGSGRL
ncbi:hypothetical protein M0R45_000537 [Rubus argutus]|uniref:Uncharacterized protein n=1 Tax=Rubus argutus TaxID=59490 RepID=A0AAW1VP44_RUBAR